MNNYKLDKEEGEILRDIASGSIASVKGFDKEKARLEQHAKATLRKQKSINIRISEHDLLRLKARALEEGLPYQTYIASVLHKNLAQR